VYRYTNNLPVSGRTANIAIFGGAERNCFVPREEARE